MSKKIKIFIAALGTVLFVLPASALAVVSDGGSSGGASSTVSVSDPCHPENNTDSSGRLIGNQPLTAAQLKSCEACKIKNNGDNCLKANPIVKQLNLIINVLTGLASIVIVAMLITGGLQYIWAGSNPQASVNARNRIIHALLAAFALLFVWGFLQWIVPGGI